MLGRRLAIALALATLLVTPDARADNDSIATVALGAGIGVHHSAQPGQAGEAQLLSSVNARFKGLWFLGLDFTYDFLAPERHHGAAEFGANMRMSLLTFVVPTEWVGVYLQAGLGARSFADLVSVTSPGNSYHAGLGAEVHVTDHISIDASFNMLVPGIGSIQQSVTTQALSATEAEGPESDHTDDLAGPEAPSIHQYLSPANFELVVRGMYYF